MPQYEENDRLRLPRPTGHSPHSGNVFARSLPTPLGPCIEELRTSQLNTHMLSGQGLPEISNVGYVASYNLMQGLSKTILVPGRPALWTPLPTTTKLAPDSGDYYRDENSARFPEYPFEPAARSIYAMDESFDPTAVDIVACGSTLGNLLRFVLGKAEPFSLVAHAVGKTIFLIRREHDPQQLIQGIHGFGHSFVEANTTWNRDTISSASHQRLISYFLGHHRVILRFEIDSYIMHEGDDLDSDEDGGVNTTTGTIEDDVAALWKVKKSKAGTKSLEILRRGTPVPLASAIDIKTRSSRKDKDGILAEQLPRLWIRQIEHLVLAFHANGVFQPATVENLSEALINWEQRNEDAIVRLINMIDLIKRKVEGAEHAKLEIRCDGKLLSFHKLSVAQARKWSGIPEDLAKQWTSGVRGTKD